MGTRNEALEILRQAEAAIRGLIETAAREQRYADVAQLAETAGALAGVLKRNGAVGPAGGASAARDEAAPPTRPRRTRAPRRKSASSRKRGAKKNYPRFERDGERLVKIGWSKKNREEYEHRAPKQAVIAVVRHLAESIGPGKVFPMEDLGAVHDRAEDHEVPTYQVYLVFAWLRHVGVVQKHGRDGYELVGSGIDENGIQELWEQLPSRRP